MKTGCADGRSRQISLASNREDSPRFINERVCRQEQHAEFLLGLIANQPDLTLNEIVAAMRKRRIAGSRSAVWRFFARRSISFKKNSVRG